VLSLLEQKGKEMKTITTTSQAIQTIVSANTRPSQIDYVSPADKAKEEEAEKFIAKLPQSEMLKAYTEIEIATDAYYSDTIQGSDGRMYSASELNETF
jgi:hypothetical protein